MITDETKPQTFSLTTPLYYVNDVPHMGSAYTTMVADAIARFKRLKGSSVLFITGTDEHGQKIQRTAVERGLDPQQHCDQVVVSFKDFWQKLNIQYDRFSRTTSQRHEAIVKEFFQRVYDNNDIYLAQQQGWYCVACEEFKEKRELREDGSCPLHPNKKAEWRDEENY
ncbi:MAG: class I tRNA ligase family protein, partial [cyanobacterium endosymbiont of Rhopalodia yunnanensis]